jgi:hypothetical protein
MQNVLPGRGGREGISPFCLVSPLERAPEPDAGLANQSEARSSGLKDNMATRKGMAAVPPRPKRPRLDPAGAGRRPMNGPDNPCRHPPPHPPPCLPAVQPLLRCRAAAIFALTPSTARHNLELSRPRRKRAARTPGPCRKDGPKWRSAPNPYSRFGAVCKNVYNARMGVR